MTLNISVIAVSPSEEPRAQALAQRLGIEAGDRQTAVRLRVEENRLALQLGKQKPIAPDFSWDTLKKKRQEGNKLGIVRACHPSAGICIADITAGWGRDAAILASFGAKVFMVERHPLMQILLEDALARRDEISRTRLDLHLIKADALHWLMQLSAEEYPDIIYMDPMHPPRKKTARVKKDLQVLQQLIAPDAEVPELLAIARQRVRKKLVLKWPITAPNIAEPTQSIFGNTVRFDCFFPEKTRFT